MILAELEIEDYKQFHGVHKFAPPPEGIIAVIGHNGAGKTTLFEAIEWCLFQPRSIAAADVPTRGQSAKPRVRIVLHDPQTDIRYVIQRTLKRGVASAFIYREDEPESQIVEGSRQVTEYVARQLVGLSHSAFVSTFFTRQKELSFFGSLNDTERRREVGRLLGMETIREAQKLINEERQAAQREADGARAAYDSETAGRDFTTELENAGAVVESRQAALALADAGHARANSAYDLARQTLTALQTNQQRDAELGKAIAQAAAAIDAAIKRKDVARAELVRLDMEAARRESLVLAATRIPDLAAAEKTQDERREAHQRRLQLLSQIEKARAGEASVTSDIAKAVRETGVSRLPGWGFINDDAATMPSSLEALVHVAASIDADASLQRATALSGALQLGRQRANFAEKVARFKNAVDVFTRDRTTLLTNGDPAIELVELDRARTDYVGQAGQLDTEERAATAAIAKLNPVAARLRIQQLGDICPACQRPYTEDDLRVMLPLLESQIAEANQTLARIKTERTRIERELQKLDAKKADAAARKTEIDTLETRIASGNEHIAQVDCDLQEATADLRRLLTEANLAKPPTQSEADEAAKHADQHRRVAGTLPLLRSLQTTFEQHQIDRGAAQTDLSAIGDAVYDREEHQRIQDELKQAQSAAAAIREIERQLAMRPAREQEQAAAEQEAASESARRTTIELERAELGFDPAVLARAVTDEKSALAEERGARDARAAAAAQLEQSRAARDRLAADQLRITRLAERSDAKTREADTLRVMYDEFNGFERFVALRLAPALAETTSDLLRAVTDGRYDSVKVTESYGIEVFDGLLESFPMDQFSGGERDVIALCARLALSRLIGSQAAHPPGFLVLDEVFGSLDRDRRHQVLETLGTLSTATDAFKQLFIISHVDDVRASPIFNEIWRITEDDDGISVLENLNASGGFEE